jgi:hypothetical protein
MNIMMYYSKVLEAKYSLVLGEYSLVLACRLACGVLATHGTLSPLLTDGLLLQELHLQWLDKLSCLDVLKEMQAGWDGSISHSGSGPY